MEKILYEFWRYCLVEMADAAVVVESPAGRFVMIMPDSVSAYETVMRVPYDETDMRVKSRLSKILAELYLRHGKVGLDDE